MTGELSPDPKRRKRAVDKLVRVYLLGGRRATLLIHVEFQNEVDTDLVARLYLYNTKIYSLLGEPVITLAVLGDKEPAWRPTEFDYALGGFETRMRFPVAKLLDYAGEWAALEESDNPFAVVVMAHLKAMETSRQPEARLEWKLRLAKSLYDRGCSDERIQQLVEFIDWLMVLDEVREERFDGALRQYEEERTMPTISPYQQRFLARGKQEGLVLGKQEGLVLGKQEAVLDNLAAHLDSVPDDIVAAVRLVGDPERLRHLQLAAIRVPDLDAFRALLVDARASG